LGHFDQCRCHLLDRLPGSGHLQPHYSQQHPGLAFSYQILAANGPTSYAATGLPPNLTLNSATGLISGALSQAGAYPVTLSATNASGSGTATLTITVNPPLSISPATLPVAVVNTSYQQTLTVSGGTTPYQTLTVTGFSAGTTGLTPAAVTTNAAAGTVTISGAPAASGTFSFTVNATDTAGAALSQFYSVAVVPPQTTPALQPLPAFVSGTNCTINWNAVSGAASYTVQVASAQNFSSILSSQTVTANTAAFTGLNDGELYYYRARSNSGPPASISSGWSNIVNATQDATPPVLTITSPASGSFTTLSTTTVAGAATDATSGVASVTANGVAATSSNSFAQWSATLPLSLGANSITVTAQDNAQPIGNASTTTVSINCLRDTEGKGIPDSWKATYGLSGAAGNAMADPYNIGYCNLLAYAFNLNPTTSPTSAPVTVTPAVNPADGLSYLTVSYRQLMGSMQISYNVEISNDLVNWSSPAGQITPIGVTPVGDGVTQIVTVRISPSMQNGGATFAHVRVSSP
jgi:hypothetical protein